MIDQDKTEGPFKLLMRAPDPAFICSAAGDVGKLHIARISHTVNPPASEHELAALREFGDEFVAELSEFYQIANGARLFVGRVARPDKDQVVAFELYPIHLWKERSASVNRWASTERIPVNSALVFGEPSRSANLLAVLTDGRKKGAVIYLDHEGSVRMLDSSLPRFLDRIGNDPVSTIYNLGCFARYSDGVSDTQWIPRIYLSNAKTQVASLHDELEGSA